MVDNKIKSNPAGKGDKIDIDVISLVQIVDKENEKIKNEPIKTVVTNSASIKVILERFKEGVSIPAYVTTQENVKRKNITMTKSGKSSTSDYVAAQNRKNITMTKGRKPSNDEKVV